MFGKTKLFVAGLSLATLVIAAPSARADDAPPAPEKPAKKDGGAKRDPSKMVDDTLAKLKLTDDQKTKVEPIVAKLNDDMHKLMSDESVKQEDKRAKGREIMMAAWKDIEGVLTPEQQAELKKIRDERKAGRDGAPGPGGKKGGDKGPKHEGGDKGPPPAPAN
ncbi:hypothetical protein BH10PLA1_BH10PLA1_07520 [soil metagenome]